MSFSFFFGLRPTNGRKDDHTCTNFVDFGWVLGGNNICWFFGWLLGANNIVDFVSPKHPPKNRQILGDTHTQTHTNLHTPLLLTHAHSHRYIQTQTRSTIARKTRPHTHKTHPHAYHTHTHTHIFDHHKRAHIKHCMYVADAKRKLAWNSKSRTKIALRCTDFGKLSKYLLMQIRYDGFWIFLHAYEIHNSKFVHFFLLDSWNPFVLVKDTFFFENRNPLQKYVS